MLFVFSFNNGKKLDILICGINDKIFIVYNPILIINSSNANFDITFIPLLAP